MGAALLTATQITFKYDFEEYIEPEVVEQKPSYEDEMQNQLAAQLHLPGTNSINTFRLVGC